MPPMIDQPRLRIPLTFVRTSVALLFLAGAVSPALAQDEAPLTGRERALMGIAASCVAFYQSAMTELGLPVEGNEAKRQTFLDVFSAFARRGASQQDFEAAFQRDVIMRTIEVTTIIENDREKAGPKVMENLPKCDGHLDEMKTAAGLG